MTPTEWLLGGDTGTSSKAICAVMTGCKLNSPFGGDTPHDPDDFGRCYRLLKLFPTWRLGLPQVGLEYPNWVPMVEAWDDLTELYEQCCEPDGRYTLASYAANKQSAQKLYDRMRELNDAGLRAAGWTESGRGCWSCRDK